MLAARTAAALAVVALAGGACTIGGNVVGGGRDSVPARPTTASSASPSAGTSAAPAPTSTLPSVVTVAGVRVSAVRATTVEAALFAAHVSVPQGQVVAVASRRRLGPDGKAGHVLVNGLPATRRTPLASGDVVTLVAGADSVEATRSLTVRVPAPNPSNLYVGGSPGRALARVGTRSGEHVIEKVLVEPRIGHLVSPGAIALTFDDGPSPTWTPQVLDLLAKAHVHATFCLIGRQAAAYQKLVRAIVANGHALCDHTWDHDQRLPSRPAGQIALDISKGAAAIKDAAGIAPTFFRAPGGNWSPTVEADARAQHMTPLRWTVDPRDWSRPGVPSILSTVYAEMRPGGVILMHDGGGDRSQTLAALRVLLTRLPAMGYHFVIPPAGPPTSPT